jgi:hypothetical protein
MRLVSDQVFHWIVYAGILGICLGWGARDVYLLTRHVGKGPGSHDQVFGSIMGLVIIAIGLSGVLMDARGG